MPLFLHWLVRNSKPKNIIKKTYISATFKTDKVHLPGLETSFLNSKNVLYSILSFTKKNSMHNLYMLTQSHKKSRYLSKYIPIQYVTFP